MEWWEFGIAAFAIVVVFFLWVITMATQQMLGNQLAIHAQLVEVNRAIDETKAVLAMELRHSRF